MPRTIGTEKARILVGGIDSIANAPLAISLAAALKLG